MKQLPLDLLRVAARQSGLVTRTQLLEFNIDSRAVNRRIQAHQWLLVTNRVIKFSLDPLSRRQELIAAVLHHENLSLTGVAALEFLGMETSHEQRIDLIGPRGTRVEPFPHAVLHTSRREFTTEDDFPSRTCHSLSVVYAMSWAKTLKQAHFYAYWSIQNGYVTMFELCDTALSNRRSSLMKRALPRVLSLRENVDTVTEHLFVDLIYKHGIRGLVYKPEFELEDGTPIHPDFGIVIGKRMLAVEIDGIHHETEEHQAIDAFRMRVLKSYGVETFRASNRELNESPNAVMRALQFRINRMSRAA